MFIEVKSILTNLISALSIMQDKIEQVDIIQKKLNAKEHIINEKEQKIKQQINSLDSRETAVKNIESIVEFSKKAKSLMIEADRKDKEASARLMDANNKIKDLTKKQTELYKQIEAEKEYNLKQANALKAERKQLNEKMQEFELKKRVAKKFEK